MKRPWRRFFAIMIDFIILFIFFALTEPIFGIGEVVYINGGYNYNLYNFDLLLAGWLYFVFFALVLKGRTPGKLLLKLSLVNADGTAMSYGKIILREIVKVPLLLIALVSFITMHALESGETLHDLILKTNVYSNKDNPELQDPNESHLQQETY